MIVHFAALYLKSQLINGRLSIRNAKEPVDVTTVLVNHGPSSHFSYSWDCYENLIVRIKGRLIAVPRRIWRTGFAIPGYGIVDAAKKSFVRRHVLRILEIKLTTVLTSNIVEVKYCNNASDKRKPQKLAI